MKRHPTNISILIIDDNATMRQTLRDILNEDGYKITGGGTIAFAKEELSKRFYNIVLVDIKLSDGTGLELLKEIRRINEEIIVIVFTGFASLESAITAINEGAFAYIQKPLNIDELKITIKRALKMQKLSLDHSNLLIELQQKMKELESLYNSKSEFTSMVSHELRTPLTAIKEGIDLVWDGSSGKINAEQREFLGIAKKNIDRLTRLINNVLDFSKLASGKTKLQMERVSINKVIESAINSYRSVAEKKGLSITAKLRATKGFTLKLDIDKINQVLDNFLDNAIKFTDRGGISIFTDKNEKTNFVKVCIEDTGIGIGKENISQLFQPFTQVREKKGRKTGGTGLGLALCKEIIEQLGGRIWVESELGRGSKFYFTLLIEDRRKVQLRA